MESDGCGLDRFEAPGKRLAQGVVDRKRTAILNENMAKFCKGPSFGEPKDFEGHFAKKPRGHRAHERGKVGLGQLVVERLIGNGGVKQRIETAVEIRQRFDAMARTGRRQREAQAKRGNGPLAPTKLCVFAAGVEQPFGKHPLELLSDHAKLSVIHLGLLSLSYKQHIQEEFRMDHHKNPYQNQRLKSTYLCR